MRYLLVSVSLATLGACAAPSGQFGQSYAPPEQSYAATAMADLESEFNQQALENAAWSRKQIKAGDLQTLSIASGKSTLLAVMRDPDATKLRDLRRNTETGAVCGYYNGKNGYGGYGGERPFVYYHAHDKSVPQLLLYTEGNDIASIYTPIMCPDEPSTVTTDIGATTKTSHQHSRKIHSHASGPATIAPSSL